VACRQGGDLGRLGDAAVPRGVDEDAGDATRGKDGHLAGKRRGRRVAPYFPRRFVWRCISASMLRTNASKSTGGSAGYP
jgi:hypothetical protein